MNRLSCVIHYSHINSTNATVMVLNETSERLLESRNARDALAGDYKHKQQSNSIPGVSKKRNTILKPCIFVLKTVKSLYCVSFVRQDLNLNFETYFFTIGQKLTEL